MKPTPEQHDAIFTHDRNLIVVAGAGSGKTHVLVERFLALLDANPDWPLNALVAITFTRKAAQEMRDRVRRELENRYHAAPNETCWAERLASMESARIDTIHGLCATILRANAAEAGIDPGFEVLDEIDARLMLDNTLDTLLQTLVETDDPTVALLLEYGADAVHNALVDLMTAEIGDPPADPETHWQQLWADNAERVVQLMLADPTFQSLIRWSPPGGSWPDEDSDDRLYQTWQKCRDPLDVLAYGGNLADRVSALETLSSGIKLVGGKANNWGGKENLNAAKDGLKEIRQRAQAALDEIGSPPGELDRRAAELLPLWVSLIRRAQEAYRRAKADERLLDFDDLERRTRSLLCDFPQVCDRYQGKEFKHLLVDEFQDTNAAQWDIVRHLADPAQPGSLFVVGDPKQSIYAFRGADVSVFDQVRRAILDAGGKAIPLAQSFRAHRRLVDSFNHIFAAVLVKDPNSPVADYQVAFEEPMTAFRQHAPADLPALEVLVVDKKRLDDDEDLSEQGRRWEAAEIAAYLRRVTGADGSEPRITYDKSAQAHRPMHYGDAAILFQSTSHITLYEEALKAAGVPYVTVAGRGYYNRQEVWDLLNLLAALHNPADNLALASALRSPMFGLSDDALLALRLRRDADGRRLLLWDALDNDDGLPAEEMPLVAFARDTLYALRGLAGRVTIAELLREILTRTGYLAILTTLPDGARRRGNVEKLVEKAYASGQVMLGAFSQYLSDLSDREAREGEAAVETVGAVTLMTVHGSKGLEFPLVILADASWERGSSRGGQIVMLDPHYGLTCKAYDTTADKLDSPSAHQMAENRQKQRDAAERKRLLYVAATRAQDYLLVTGQASPSSDGQWKMKGWLGWLWEGLGLVELPPQTITLDHYPWGSVSISLPEQPPPEAAEEYEESVSAWDSPAVQTGQPLPGGERPSPLLKPVHPQWDAPARHLTATQLADLGGAQIEALYAERFRRSILHDAPSHIGAVSTYGGGVSRRIIGEIVHKALRWWPLPSEKTELEAVLESYAWQLGIIIPEQQRYAARQAQFLLEQFKRSDVYGWLESAQTVYREIPFLYRSGHRFIHGVLDVLFQPPGGSWVVLDYKTSLVSGCRDGEPGGQRIVDHARRYHLQVGVYAAAVRAQLGDISPDVYIHYLRHGQTVRVESAQWEAVLARLEDYIRESLFNQE
ncbi:MAG: UvrD-helicase domain-containing protein [Chloroflexi bacterium]|nr:UvrD-helicase domain-containing protein [Chloroflexota bacterium]